MAWSRIDRRAFGALAAAAAFVWAPGCGGQVGDGGLEPQGNDPTGGAQNASTGGQPATGGTRATGGRPGTGGTTPNTGGRPSTGGTRPTGGTPSSGGIASGTGGVVVGGRPNSPSPGSVAACYAERGVYLDGTCYVDDTRSACLEKTEGITVTCERPCACRSCAFEYARCIDDGGCRFINACAELVACRGVEPCLATQCSGLIQMSGGPKSLGSQLFDELSACMTNVGCSPHCR